jgi:hypothetical protein
VSRSLSKIPIPAEAKSHITRAAVLKRHHPEQRERIEAEKQQARVLTLEEHIRTVVAAAPPLSQEQCDRLALILRGGASG